MSIVGDIIGGIASGRAAKAQSGANIAAEHGVMSATTSATQGIQGALGKAYTDVPAAGAAATGLVNAATGTANAGINAATAAGNQTLQNTLAGQESNLNPYLASGAQGNEMLQKYAASNPQFKFSPEDYMNSDAYKFQLAQGENAIQNRASATGGGSGGDVLKELTKFGQGLGATYYQNAFDRAHQTFETNRDTTMGNINALNGQGNFGTGQYNQAAENAGNQESANTIGAGMATGRNTLGAGYFGGQTGVDLQKFLAGLNLQGNETSGRYSMEGAKTAGDFAVGAGQARAHGIMDQAGALSSGISDIAGLISGFGGGG